MDDSTTQDVYRRQGFGQRLGFGERPALLIIDMQHDFCSEESKGTLWPGILETIEPTARLAAAARAHGVPVIYSQGLVAADGSSMGLWRHKITYHGTIQIEGSPGAEIIPELAPQPGDRVIRKWRPSVFFRTDLEVFLGRWGIDTLLLAGTSLSGCVRATTVDAFMRDIRPMIVRECVADRSEAVLEANFFDLDQKYADVVGVEETIAYVEALQPAAESAA